jgi:uncharacterized protein (TIGR03067 family)
MHTPWLLLTWVSVSLMTVADRPINRSRHGRGHLEGSWALASVREGDSKDLKLDDLQDPVRRWCKGLQLTFTNGRVVVRTAAEPKPKRLTYKLNPTKNPKEIDFSRGFIPTNESIYRVQGDTLMLAFSLGWELVSGGTYKQRQYHIGRPRDFKQTKDRAAPVVLILRRV